MGPDGSRRLREPSASRDRIRMAAKPPQRPALQLEVRKEKLTQES